MLILFDKYNTKSALRHLTFLPFFSFTLFLYLLIIPHISRSRIILTSTRRLGALADAEQHLFHQRQCEIANFTHRHLYIVCLSFPPFYSPPPPHFIASPLWPPDKTTLFDTSREHTEHHH